MREWWSSKVRLRVYRRVARIARRVHGRGPLLVAMGDSLTDPTTAYTLPWQIWLRHVRRHGYKTVNLGVSGDTTTDMRRRIEQFMVEGKPEVAVVFGGANDVRQGIDPTDTKRNLTFIVEWLRERGVEEIVLIGPGVAHSTQSPAWASSIDTVRTVVREVAEDHDVVFVDLAQFLRDRVARGIDQNFSRVPYRQSRSWQISATDAHFNAYGQRLIAEAYLAATGP